MGAAVAGKPETFELMKPIKGDGWKLRAEDLIINWEENGRHKTTIDEEFIADMLAGQMQNSGVTQVQGGKWKLVWGYRRAMAVIEINRRKLLPEPMLLKVELDKNVNPEAAFLKNLRENKARKSTNAVDDAYNITKLKDLFGWNDKSIAEFYHKTTAWVSKTRKILQLPTKFHDLIEQGNLTAAQAEALVDADEGFREQLYNELKAGAKLSAGDIRKRAREEGHADATRDASLKPKHIVAFFEELAEDEEAPEKVREFAAIAGKWLHGNTRMGNAKFKAELMERLKTR